MWLDFVIQGVTIFYRDKRYQFSGGIESLIGAIRADVEQFLVDGQAEGLGGG